MKVKYKIIERARKIIRDKNEGEEPPMFELTGILKKCE